MSLSDHLIFLEQLGIIQSLQRSAIPQTGSDFFESTVVCILKLVFWYLFFSLLTLFLPAMGWINPYTVIMWHRPVGIRLRLCVPHYGITLTSSLCRLALVWPKILISFSETHVYTHNFTIFSTYARKCKIFNLIDIGSIMESGENSFFFIIFAMPAIA